MNQRVLPEALPDVSRAAAAMADPTRAAMCAALMDGRAWTPGELGRYAGVARSTASEHVSVLVARGLASEIRQGRHRYVMLAGEEVAGLLERLAALDERTFPTPPSARVDDESRPPRRADLLQAPRGRAGRGPRRGAQEQRHDRPDLEGDHDWCAHPAAVGDPGTRAPAGDILSGFD